MSSPGARPDCAWSLSDLASVPKNGVRVMSTFACGGGSSMGYKLAGCTIVAANDIDPQMAKHYKRNLRPPLYFLCPIGDLVKRDLPAELYDLDILDGSPPCSTFSMAGSREKAWGVKKHFLCPIGDLVKRDLPAELYDLDILDGSPPCSTFSMAGSREKAWGVEKHFREGQAKQVLSDLFFDYLDLVGKLRPKVAIAENVKGMLAGNAKGYTRLVMRRFKELGYRAQLFLVNAADCGVPQKRERVFFVALRDDIKRPKLKLAPRARWVSASEAVADLGPADPKFTAITPLAHSLWAPTRPGSNFQAAHQRLRGKPGWFNRTRLDGARPSQTLTSHFRDFYHWAQPRRLDWPEYRRLGSFPEDYWAESPAVGCYMVGMSVPPKMTEQVARAVCEQWLHAS